MPEKPFTPDNLDNTGRSKLTFRAVPFGMPNTRNNEINNPGRQQYANNNGFAVTRGTDAFNVFWFDENMQIGSRTEWQSGPSDCDIATDQVSKHAGYWSSPAGNGCDWANAKGSSPGSPEKEYSISVTSKDPDLKCLFRIGRTKWGDDSYNEGFEYGIVGASCYVRPSHNQQTNDPKNKAEIGLKHFYISYKVDAEPEEIDGIIGGLSSLRTGLNIAWDTGKILFPDYLSGSIEGYDKETRTVTGIVNELPEKFDPEEYFAENNITNGSILNFIKESSVLDVFKGIKFTDSYVSRTVLSMLVEKINIGFNRKAGLTGGHNFKIDPQSFLRIIKERGEVNFLDLIGEYVVANLPDAARELLTGKVTLSDILDGKGDISIDELAMMLRVVRKGGDIGFDGETQSYYGEYRGGRTNVDNYLELTQSDIIGGIDILPTYKNLFPFCYSQKTVGKEPDWYGAQDVVATYKWPDGAPDRVKINANPFNDVDVVIWWGENIGKVNEIWKRGPVLKPSYKQRLITKKGEYFRFGEVTGRDEPTVTKHTVHFEGTGFVDPVTVDTENPEIFESADSCPQGYELMDVFMAADVYNGAWYPRWETAITSQRFVTELGQRYTFRPLQGATPEFTVRFLFTNDLRLEDPNFQPNRDTVWVREEIVEHGKSLTIDSPGRFVYIVEHMGGSTGSTDEFEPWGKTSKCWQMERIGADCSPGFTEVRQYKSHVGKNNYDGQLEDFPTFEDNNFQRFRLNQKEEYTFTSDGKNQYPIKVVASLGEANQAYTPQTTIATIRPGDTEKARIPYDASYVYLCETYRGSIKDDDFVNDDTQSIDQNTDFTDYIPACFKYEKTEATCSSSFIKKTLYKASRQVGGKYYPDFDMEGDELTSTDDTLTFTPGQTYTITNDTRNGHAIRVLFANQQNYLLTNQTNFVADRTINRGDSLTLEAPGNVACITEVSPNNSGSTWGREDTALVCIKSVRDSGATPSPDPSTSPDTSPDPNPGSNPSGPIFCTTGYQKETMYRATELVNGIYYPNWTDVTVADFVTLEPGDEITVTADIRNNARVRLLFTNTLWMNFTSINDNSHWVSTREMQGGETARFNAPAKYMYLTEHTINGAPKLALGIWI